MENENVPVTGFSIFYRIMWMVLSFLSLGWGVIIGLSLAGRQIMSDDMVLTGTVIIVGLVLTLAIAGRQRS